LWQFLQYSRTKWSLTSFHCCFSFQIGDINHDIGYSTFTHEALATANDILFSPSNGARSGVEQLCFVLTDGKSDNTQKTLAMADQLKSNGIKIIAVGVGNKVYVTGLERLQPVKLFDRLT